MNFLNSIIAQNPITVNILPEDISEEDELKRATREKRLNSCGRKIASGHRADVGRYTQFVYQCGIWRDCPSCLTNRVLKYKDQIKSAVDINEKLHVILIDSHEADAMAEFYGRGKYRRFPVSEDQDVVFFVASHNPKYEDNSLSFTFEEFENLDIPWRNIVYTPEGKRVSGNLGLPAKEEHPGMEKIQVEYCITNAPAEARSKAAEMAAQDTAELNPTTPVDCEACLDIRNGRYRLHLKEMGYRIDLVFYRNEMCDPQKLDWLGGLSMQPAQATDDVILGVDVPGMIKNIPREPLKRIA